ncbi:MAG TPA: Gfo/Idh/MocA family oxidoreductase [Candidatus Dormibacteraeota bacterium]|nr:Gfo/Idh/MocA family oxidoreductase [Candidatus Dormibacteraeota bacterium]
MANSLDECESILAAERASKGRVFGVQNRAYTAAMWTMHKIIAEGGIGTPTTVQTNGLEGTELILRMGSLRTDAKGVVGTQMFHNLYLVPWLIGDEIHSIVSDVSRGPNSRLFAADENAAAIIRYRGGAMHLAFGTLGRPSDVTEHTVHVQGTEGELRSERVGDQDHRRELLYIARRGDSSWEQVPLRNPQARGYEFAQMWRDFMTALRTGGEPMMTTASAIQAMVWVDELYRSASERTAPEVRLRDTPERGEERAR